MPWLPLYMDSVDAVGIAESLGADPDVAFVVSNGPGRWIACKSLAAVPNGRYCLWHQPSGPLPLLRGSLPDGSITDPWAGWTEVKSGADPTTPYFGAGHPGVIWWNVRTTSVERRGGIGMSSFEWIGNWYRRIGNAAHPSTEAWWKRLRALVKRMAKRIPRSGPLEGVGCEIWAMPSALARIESGEPRDG